MQTELKPAEQQEVQELEAQAAPETEVPAEETNAPSRKKKKEKEPTTLKMEIMSWIVTLVAAVVFATVIRMFIFEPIRVDGESMCDTLQNGEIMLVTKPEYLFGDPEFGDVIICKYPGRKENFVKRVMGVPGDEIMVIANIVILTTTVIVLMKKP